MVSIPNISIMSYDSANRSLENGDEFSHVLSINDPGHPPPPALARHNGRHLVLHFHDVTERMGVLTPPTMSDVRSIIGFAQGLEWYHRVLIHCAAGISRSSASAIAVVAALKLWNRNLEHQRSGLRQDRLQLEASMIVDHVLSIKQDIFPNALIVNNADAMLGYQGELYGAYVDRWMPGIRSQRRSL